MSEKIKEEEITKTVQIDFKTHKKLKIRATNHNTTIKNEFKDVLNTVEKYEPKNETAGDIP